MKRITLNLKLTCLLGVLSMTLIACSSTGGTSGDNLSGTSNKPAGAVEISMVIEAEDYNTYSDWANKFAEINADKGWTVKFIQVAGGQVQGKQDTLIAAKQAPDIIVGGDIWVYTQYKYLEPLDELITRDNAVVKIEDFIPQIINGCKYNQKTYYLPQYFNSSLLYYNKDIIENYDKANPGSEIGFPSSDWTYRQFINAAKKLTIGSGNNVSQWGSYNTIGWWGEWLTHIRQNKGEIMSQDGWVTLNTPEAVAGLKEYLSKLNGEDKCGFTTGQNELGGFAGKCTAMNFGGHISDWADLKRVKDLNWDVELLPNNNGSRTGEFAIDGLGVYKKSEHKEVAWEFIKYLCRQKTGEDLLNHPYVACRESEKQELLAIPHDQRPAPQNLEAVYESVKYNKILPQFNYFSTVATTYIQDQINKAVEGKITPEKALEDATNNANAYIRSL